MNNIRSIMAVPILFHDQVRGLIYVDNRLRAGIFREENLELLNWVELSYRPSLEVKALGASALRVYHIGPAVNGKRGEVIEVR